jgi:hypothetical protein
MTMNVKTVKIYGSGTHKEEVTKQRADFYSGGFCQAYMQYHPPHICSSPPLVITQDIHATSRLGHVLWAAHLTGMIIYLMHDPDALLEEMDWSRRPNSNSGLRLTICN